MPSFNILANKQINRLRQLASSLYSFYTTVLANTGAGPPSIHKPVEMLQVFSLKPLFIHYSKFK